MILLYLVLFLLGMHLYQILVPVPERVWSNEWQNRAMRWSWNPEAFDSSIRPLLGLAPVQFAIVSLPTQIFFGNTSTERARGTNSASSQRGRYWYLYRTTKQKFWYHQKHHSVTSRVTSLCFFDYLQALQHIPLLFPILLTLLDSGKKNPS